MECSEIVGAARRERRGAEKWGGSPLGEVLPGPVEAVGRRGGGGSLLIVCRQFEFLGWGRDWGAIK